MEPDTGPRRIEKRNRPPVSCEPCRTRKLKCSRASPCESCIRRDKVASCVYASNAIRGGARGVAGSNSNRPVKPKDLKDRLSSLETLVSSFLAQANSHASTTREHVVASDRRVADVTVDMAVEQLSKATIATASIAHSSAFVSPPNDRSTVGEHATLPSPSDGALGAVKYVDQSHWLSILDDIKEVRERLSEDADHSVSGTSPRSATPGASTTNDTWNDSSDASVLLAGMHGQANVSLEDVLARLPTKSICDMLLSWYFNSQFMVLGVIHPAKFQMEYEEFWGSPSTTSPLWIALLFSVLGIAVCLRQIAGIASKDNRATISADSEDIPQPSILQQSTLKCLVLGRYTTANAHALEALILHLQGTFTSHALNTAASAASLANEAASKNSTALVEAWFLMGTIIRLAFRMGYHREEASSLATADYQNHKTRSKTTSVFDAEMRRRVWINVVQIDALLSFQIGLPSMISSEACNTKTPLNLEYADLYPSMTSLPPARSLEHYTPSLYTIVKAGVMAVFKKITAHAMSLPATAVTQEADVPAAQAELAGEEDAYDRKTAVLDAEMRSIYNDPAHVPLLLRARDVSASSIMDSACLISQRSTIEILHLKGLVVLHRRYVTYPSSTTTSCSSPPTAAPYSTKPAGHEARRSERHRGFRRTCVAAAIGILARQADLHTACSPGGRLFHDRWMAICAIPVSDYLLAAMVVCLDLSVRMRDGRHLHRGSGNGCRRKTGESPGSGGQSQEGGKAREAEEEEDDLLTAREYHALQTSHRIYTTASSVSPDARVAAQVLGLMLRKIAESDVATMSGADEVDFDDSSAATSINTGTTTLAYACLDGSPSMPTMSWNHTPSTTSSQTGVLDEPIELVCDLSELSYALPMSMMIDGSESIDWGLLDQFIQNIDPSLQDQSMELF